jgi:hypothetical protein
LSATDWRETPNVTARPFLCLERAHLPLATPMTTTPSSADGRDTRRPHHLWVAPFKGDQRDALGGGESLHPPTRSSIGANNAGADDQMIPQEGCYSSRYADVDDGATLLFIVKLRLISMRALFTGRF